MHVALTIAGSDSSGGAGIQADLKTFARFGVFGTSVVTAVTAQNTHGVVAWEPVSPALVRSQMIAVLDDLPPGATKTGMLGSTAAVRTIIDVLRERRLPRLVVDPVLVSTSGHPLLQKSAVSLVRHALIPLATLVTPNLDEVRALLGTEVDARDEDAMCRAAETFVHQLGARAALVKGGHGIGEQIVDVLYDGEWSLIRHPRLHTTSTHGTGCTLAAAVTAGLAKGDPLVASVRTAIDYVQRAIASAPVIESGYGPVNHSA